MKLKKKGKRYYVHYQTPEGMKSMSTGCETLEKAKAVVEEAGIADIEKAAKAGKLGAAIVSQIISGKVVNVDDAIQRYYEYLSVVRSGKTAANQVSEIKAWARKSGAGKRPISSVTLQQVSEYINNPSDKTKAQTKCYKLACLRGFFEFCVSQHYCVTSPAAAVKVAMHSMLHEQKERKVRQVFTEGEVDTIIKASTGFWHFATVFGRDAGLRLGDIAQMEWACFSSPGELVVWTDKRDKRVSLPITQRMHDAVGAIIPEDPEFLWPSERETVKDPRRRAILSVYFGRLLKSCGIHGKSFHCLRHTYATDCANKGIPMPHISKSLGHSNSKTTEGYIHQ